MNSTRTAYLQKKLLEYKDKRLVYQVSFLSYSIEGFD